MSLNDLRLHVRQFNWLTFFALLCVGVTSGFIIYMALRLTDTLASPDWCARAIQAEKLSGSRPNSSCIDLLTIQLKSLALDNHIYAVTLAACLAVLVVVVIAKARLDLQVSKDSARLAMQSDRGSPTPETVAAAAQGAAAGAVAAAATTAATPPTEGIKP